MQDLRFVDIGIGELVGLLHRAVEVRANDVAIEIADDEQRRIEERFAIAQQLAIGFVEIFLFAFVLPGKTAALPDIRETTLGFGLFRDAVQFTNGEKLSVFDDPLLKTKRLVACRISSCWRRLT